MKPRAPSSEALQPPAAKVDPSGFYVRVPVDASSVNAIAGLMQDASALWDIARDLHKASFALAQTASELSRKMKRAPKRKGKR